MQLGPGMIVGGKYRIERALARGGMGSVWVARHVQLGSTLAIKFLDASFAASPAHRSRFEREARASANLKSPHVVQVHDYGFEGDAPYLVMELLEGEDLGQRLNRVHRMSPRDTAKVLTHVGKALRKAHEAGFAHRDLKPANLFVARVDDDEVVKILDFGIAKESNSVLGDATRTGEVMGSPHYMSPEQVRAEKDLDYRTDLWSLAIILFRMLVGSLPFPGDQLGPVLAKILTDPIPVPSQLAPDLPASIDAFFARALTRDKAQRFQSVGEMVEAFQLAAGGKDAIPSVSMSLGTGTVPAAQGGGTATWNPQGPAAPITASGPQTGPVTGVTGGLASTGPNTRAKGGAGIAIAVVALVLAVGGAAAAFFFLYSPSGSGAAATGSASAATTTIASAEPAPPPSLFPSASASAEPTVAPSASASASGASSVKAGGVKPRASGAPTREKWF